MQEVGNHIDPSCTVLIVDDFAEWRSEVRWILAAQPHWRIVAEASDGNEAVTKALEFQPNIILLDVGLPGINGIEAAKLIRKHCPRSSIIFLTLNSDEDLKEMALGAGGAAYLLKPNVAAELLETMSAAIANSQRMA